MAQPTPITSNQWAKIRKALLYSTSSGFVGGFVLSLASILQPISAGTPVAFDSKFLVSLLTGAIVGGVVGALNGAAVTIKQLYSEE